MSGSDSEEEQQPVVATGKRKAPAAKEEKTEKPAKKQKAVRLQPPEPMRTPLKRHSTAQHCSVSSPLFSFHFL